MSLQVKKIRHLVEVAVLVPERERRRQIQIPQMYPLPHYPRSHQNPKNPFSPMPQQTVKMPLRNQWLVELNPSANFCSMGQKVKMTKMIRMGVGTPHSAIAGITPRTHIRVGCTPHFCHPLQHPLGITPMFMGIITPHPI